MATMYPESLEDKPVVGSEKRVFEKLKKLHQDIHVVWSVPWTKGGRDKEVDFVIIDPRRPAILVLEVKGGDISLKKGQWYSTDIEGQRHEINPVKQATNGSYDIRNMIEESSRSQITFSWGWGVVFPDASCPDMTNGATISRERVIDQNDLDNPIKAIDRVFKDFCSKASVTQQAADQNFVQETLRVILPTYEFVRSISSYMRENEEKWIQLDPAQMQVLGILKSNKRGLIYGAAGTGKTVIAQRAADDAAKNDKKKVLYLCFNAPLAAAIYSRVKREDEIYNVYTYNGLCTKIVDAPNPDPDAVLIALKNSRARFSNANAIRRARFADEFYWDVVIVDEGQDFRANSWPVIEGLVEDDGSLYVFYDPYQAIAGKLDDSIIPVIQKEENISNVPLYCNYRNTAKIGEAANKLVMEEEDVPEPSLDMAPQGAPVKYMSPTEIHDMGRLIKNEINTWIKGGIPKNGIAVLTANHIDSCQRSYENIYELCKKGFLQDCYDNNELPQDRPTLISIERFKGLEADAVVLVVPTNSEEEYWKIHYVGVSRARQFLTVVKAPLDPTSFKNHLESELGRLVESMTDEQIKTCGNIKENNGTREIPAEIRMTILAKMKSLNNKEECQQNDSDKRYAFNCFWRIFHDRDIDLLKRLVENMRHEQIESCCDIPVVSEGIEREIPVEIRKTIDNTMSKLNDMQLYKLFWGIFDEANYDRVLESELGRLVENMTDEKIKECCNVSLDKDKRGVPRDLDNEIKSIVQALNRNNFESARRSFWGIFDEANYDRVLESELGRLIENMTDEKIKTCGNVKENNGTREIPAEIRMTILAKMKSLNNKEEQDHNDKASAFEYFWTTFDKRSEFLKNLESKLERLVEDMTYEQIKKCGNVKESQKETRKNKNRKIQKNKKKEIQKQREIPVEIRKKILATMKALNGKEEQDQKDEAFASEYFWTIFDKCSEFLKNLESKLKRLVEDMTYKQIEECYNIQGTDDMREIPEDILKKILTEVKVLNDKEGQYNSDEASAFKYFWTIFDTRFSDFMKNLKPEGLTLALEDLVQEITYEEYCEINNVQAEKDGTRCIPREICKKIRKKIGGAALREKKNRQIVYEYFWTIFDEVSKPIISAKFYYNIRKRLHR